MRKLVIAFAAVAALAVAGTASAGGWATVALSSVPTGVGPGEPWNVEVTVLQHGRTPLAGVQPTITIRNLDNGSTKTFAAKPTGEVGVYAASVVFPSGGTWTYAVYDGFDQYGGAKMHTFAPFTIDGGAADDGTPLRWTIGGTAALFLALLLLVLTPRIRRATVAVPATGAR